MIHKKWLTTKELTKYLGMSKTSIYSRIQRGTIPYTKMCRTLLFDIQEIDKLLQKNSTKIITSNNKRNY